MPKELFIQKADGTTEPWDPHKLERSLKAAGAHEELIFEIIGHIERDLREGMTTYDIYKHAFALLKKNHRPFAAQYSLKKAIFELGPSGFPFERFIAHILKYEGYTTEVGVIAQGKCVQHEIDVVAQKDDERIIVEAKYHNDPAIRSDVKVALYVHARFNDVVAGYAATDDKEHYHHVWLITNTNFSSQAIEYGKCVGMELTGWNYPRGRTLQDIVQRTQTHPLTCLTTLTTGQKQHLLKEGTVLCQEVLQDPDRLARLGLSGAKIDSVLDEGAALCRVV